MKISRLTHSPWMKFGLLAMFALMAAGRPALADPLERFYGKYEGHAVSDTRGLIEKRDLNVEIRKTEQGFSVRWVIVSRKASGKVKRQEYKVRFRPSEREKVYRSAMRTDMFGQDVPLDPMKGDPYVWAKLDGQTLTVYALIINEDGGYEMQTTERTVSDEGLELRYSRVSNGEIARVVNGSLKRVD